MTLLIGNKLVKRGDDGTPAGNEAHVLFEVIGLCNAIEDQSAAAAEKELALKPK